MLRRVHLWTWVRRVRDHGPRDRNFLAAMLCLATFMDGDSGETFVGIHKWAKAARMGVNTIRKMRDEAIDKGWLHAETKQGGRIQMKCKTLFCPCVPADVQLTEKDELLRDVILRSFGEIPESVSPNVDTDNAPRVQSVSLHTDTEEMANAIRKKSVSDEIANAPDLYQRNENLYQQEAQSVSASLIPKSSSEVLSKFIKNEGRGNAEDGADTTRVSNTESVKTNIEPLGVAALPRELTAVERMRHQITEEAMHRRLVGGVK